VLSADIQEEESKPPKPSDFQFFGIAAACHCAYGPAERHLRTADREMLPGYIQPPSPAMAIAQHIHPLSPSAHGCLLHRWESISAVS
jgi:hypothetical protein